MASYDEKVAAATTSQGLDPLLAALDTMGVPHGLAQTGGFCMAVTVPTEANAGTYAITNDEGSWIICFYEGDGWTEVGEPDLEDTHDTLDSLLEVLRPLAK